MSPATATIRREPDNSDARLVRACLKGDESAWSDLIDKYKNLIYSIPLRYGFSQEDSADIFQAVCMDLLADLANIREPNALAGWLIQVTRNKCFHRKKEKVRELVENIEEHELPATDRLSEEVIAEVEQQLAIREVLRGLPARCRKLVELLFFEIPPRPYDEVAAELGLALGSIGIIRRRCLETVKRRMQDAGA